MCRLSFEEADGGAFEMNHMSGVDRLSITYMFGLIYRGSIRLGEKEQNSLEYEDSTALVPVPEKSILLWDRVYWLGL